MLNLGHAYVVLNGARSQGAVSATLAQGMTLNSTFGALSSSPVKLDPVQHTMTVNPSLGTPSTSLSWQSDASIGAFGKPDPFSADLNAGALTASYPIDIPAGPGGLTPPVSLAYNSAGVNEQHNPSSAAGWIGEGWTLSMGSINWSEHNVLAGCQLQNCGTEWENSWQLSDPYGTGSDLIPPNINVSTYFDDTPNFYCGTGNSQAFPCPILWHTANEAYAKIYAYVGPFAIPGAGPATNSPCFRVWLKNGIMEEFGCTQDSIQYYYEPGNGQGALLSAWNLDLITDPQGNQIHLTYQQDMEPWTNPVTHATFNYPRDVVLSTIEYDSPNCHNAQTMCTGSNWAPLVRVNFASSHTVTRASSPLPSGCNTGANLRCDDPFDLSGSNGVAAPLIQNTFLLNDIQVQVRSSGTGSWNTLRDYQLHYELSAPTTITDPSSGRQQSVAGMLDLTGMQQLGDTGATALLYSGNDTSTSSSFAYMKVFDLSSQHLVVGSNTTLTYWIYPQSTATSGLVSGSNSTCVAVDLIFTDGTNLRDSGAVDQNGVRVHPAQQCGHLMLDQWNRVTTNIGAVANGKTLSKLDIGYDQPANTGGYRGYVDDISLTNPSSSTPLWSSTLESGDPQPTWTSTVDTGPESGSGKSSNVGGICCGLTGPELATRQELAHADGAALPARTFTYTSLDNSYVDSFFHPNPSNNCGPSWNTGNGSGCLLWAQSHANDDRYLASASNGMGLAQSFSWSLARDNTHGVPGGGSNTADPLYCNSHQSGYPCNEADDGGWSRVVLTQESSTTIRLTQNGQGGAQTSTPVTSTTNYSYQLSYPLVAQQCSDCVAGMYWGNQNDVDYLSYYNGTFMGFTQVTVSHADGTKEVHTYFGTEGWGIYDTAAGQATCGTPNPCHNDPWWDLTNAAHGHETEAFFYDTDGTTLLKHTTASYQAVCPPSGVSGTPASSIFGHFDGKLVSALDDDNPVAVCDVQQTQQVEQVSNGTANNVTTTTAWTYDNFGRVLQETITSNGGTPGTVVHQYAYVWNDAITATKTSATGTHILDTVASTTTQDSVGNHLSCSDVNYDGQGYLAGQTSALTGGLTTAKDSYTNCGTSSNGFTPSGQIRTTMTYDAYGNQVASDDPDANASISGHTGCTVSSTQYTSCSAYDSTFQVLPTSSSNALNQTSSTGYTATALGGFGLWPISTTDPNNQSTTYGYDSLGRMSSLTLPAETSGSTKAWSYTTWCSGPAAQAPCVELDEVDRMNATTTVTTRGFYDGEGRLVETRVSGPNNQDVVTYVAYDVMGRKIFTSNPYFVAAYTGPAGPAAFSLPDSSQPGSSTAYPTMRQTSVTDPLSQTATTTVSVQCGVSGTTDTGCYVLSTVVDASSHQRSTLTDGLGHEGYDLRYTGNSSATYALYALTSYTYDVSDNLLTIKHPANNATTSFTYDAAGHQVGMNDPDRGVESYSYDPNGNLTQTIDARGSAGTLFQGYDGLNRPLWRNTTNSPTGARVTYSYDSTASGNMGVGRKTGETFSGSGGLSGSYAFVYDQRGQQTSMTTTINGTNYPTQASYDDAGDLISQTYPTGEVVNATYSAQGWLSQLSTTSGGTTTTLASNISYTGTAGAAMHITGMSLGNGVYSYGASYDLDQRLTSSSLTRSSDSTLLYQTQPGYDGVGNVTSVTTTLQAGTDNQHFCYDEQNRLTWAWSNGSSPCGTFTAGTLTAAQYQQSYTYDTNGRLTSAQSGYTYGDSHHLHAVTATGSGYSAAYDAAGNMTCRAPSSATTCSGTQTGQQLSYDAEGNLSTWQNQPTATSTVNYLYDGEGTRVASQLVSGGNTTLTSYIGKLETVVTGSSTTTTTYYSAGALRVAEAVNGTFSYLGNDVLGSTTVALNAAGQLTAAQLYGPYGNVRYSSGTMPTDIGFTGQRGDSATGLDYYNARYYDPVVGLFISADTVLPENGYDPWSLSRYAYVQGNPETMTDPTGHCIPWCVIMLAGVVAGAIGGAAAAVATDLVTGQPITWQSVGKGAAIGAVAGFAITGGALLLGAIPAVGAALTAGTAATEGLAATGAAISSYLTVNAGPIASTLLGSSIGGAVSSAITSFVSGVANHIWPDPPDQNAVAQGAHAQATADAQKIPAIQTAAARDYSATATAQARQQDQERKDRIENQRNWKQIVQHRYHAVQAARHFVNWRLGVAAASAEDMQGGLMNPIVTPWRTRIF